MTAVPGFGSDTGATNTPDSGPSATEGGAAVRNDLRGSAVWGQIKALAAILEPEAFDPDQPADPVWRQRTRDIAIGHAAKVLTVARDAKTLTAWPSPDDDTAVRAVAEALAGVGGWEIRWPRDGEEPEDQLVRYLSLARAAVRAIREET